MNQDMTCKICGTSEPNAKLLPGALVSEGIAALIHIDYPDWSPNCAICSTDLAKYKSLYIGKLLETERGELTEIENDVLASIKQEEILSRNINNEFDSKKSVGENIADKVAEFGGSWKFIIMFGCFIFVWLIINSITFFIKPYDPYPYILLNLLLSCLAALQAPVIMMSQNRQELKDRLRAEHDYQINLKAELEIRHLNEKIDHMLKTQWERLVEIQSLQMQDLQLDYGPPSSPDAK